MWRCRWSSQALHFKPMCKITATRLVRQILFLGNSSSHCYEICLVCINLMTIHCTHVISYKLVQLIYLYIVTYMFAHFFEVKKILTTCLYSVVPLHLFCTFHGPNHYKWIKCTASLSKMKKWMCAWLKNVINEMDWIW